jgi:hypothetical protein
MGLPGVFEVYQLAIGPSTVFTTGALRIGQAFRDVLLSSPYRSNYRILIELSGNFSKFGRENNSDMAVVAGLGGYTLDEPGIFLKSFYSKIKENGCFPFFGEVWPFNPESDLVFKDSDQDEFPKNIIRFHLISRTGQPVYQAEYLSIGNGLIKGTGIADPITLTQENSPEKLSEIKIAIYSGKISPLEYVRSSECHRHRISIDHFNKRMMVTWKLMMSNTVTNQKAENENARAAIYAMVLSQEILNNRPVITAPTCTGSAIVPAVLRFFQEKYLFPDERMVESLVVGGLFGSLFLERINQSGRIQSMQTEVACSAAMASAGAAFLLGGTIEEIERAATMTIMLYANPNQKNAAFKPETFVLLNTMVAQTLPSLVELSRLQADNPVPKLDEALDLLFQQ